MLTERVRRRNCRLQRKGEGEAWQKYKYLPTLHKPVSSKFLFNSPLYVSLKMNVQFLAADIGWVKVWRG